MSRPAATILASIIGKVAPGWALDLRGGVFDQLLAGAAAGLAQAEVDAEAMIDEIDPRTAIHLLPDFERVLGPDPCGRDQADLSLARRQQLAHQRWTAVGGQSLPYLIGIAANLGVDVEIEELWPTMTGCAQCGDELTPQGEQFVWIVRMAAAGLEEAVSDGSQAGDPMYRILVLDIECELRRIAHEHTIPVFIYEVA